MNRVPRLHVLTHPDRSVDWYITLLQKVAEERDVSSLAIHLRDKQSNGKRLLESAQVLRAHRTSAKLFVNGRIDVAIMVEADGVQLGESALSPAEARLLRSDLCVGASRHSLEGVEHAHAMGADFVTISPLFSVPGKNRPIGVSGLQAVLGSTDKIIALGGIDAMNARSVIDAGAYGVMVQRCVAFADAPIPNVIALLDAVSHKSCSNG